MSQAQALYLRGPVFDRVLILGIPVLAILTAYYALYRPEHFIRILTLDLFFLGYHHVIATYTRLSYYQDRPEEMRFLVYYLPAMVLAAVSLTALAGFSWVIFTLYLHWQWWHYTRQSEGISKSLQFKTGSDNQHGGLARAVFYLVPLTAFLAMSARQPETFLFTKVWTLPVPGPLLWALVTVTGLSALWWLVGALRGLFQGQVSPAHLLYLLSHHGVYLVAYVLIEDITIGWLAINIWHNFQYILFVWHFNANRFREGVDPKHRVISWLVQPRMALVYAAFCILATALFYGAVDGALGLLQPHTSLPLVLIAYQSINFHHYIVDSYIWKIRRKEVKRTIGLEA
ncbi:hypothetical protein [Ferrimonas balearica]|uniref:hypothetical protein n=1 Tax=Ferrimonas balearica TaxID=44012 RepID=UPI001C99ACF8|nr:hypothetical protein [Ferrimonas balearica]MBY5991771.1 hypothetical protein [Ferrimonas balearica]